MAELTASRSITLSNGNPRLQTPVVSIGKLTSEIVVKLLRPDGVNGVTWGTGSKVKITIGIIIDGVEQQFTGSASGGIRGASSEYVLRIRPTRILGAKGREYLKTAIKDAEGYYNDVPLEWATETATTVEAYLILELLSGPSVSTTLLLASTTESEAPKTREHFSVAFDAATDVLESSGDATVTLSHTCSGSNRAAFIGVGNVANTAGYNSTPPTYNGVSSTEIWDQVFGTNYGNAGNYIVNPATGAQTVSSTVTGGTSIDGHFLGVVSFTGVDQTTAVGTHQFTSGSAPTDPTVTVASVGSDDLVVDLLVDRQDTPSIGADQTLRCTEDAGFPTAFRISTQPGTAGGVMSWSGAGTFEGYGIGAVAFKPFTGTLEQEGFRWGVDDDTESAHTWEAAQDTNITIAGNQSRLLRVLVNATLDPAAIAYTLRYQKNGSGGYAVVPVGATSDVTPTPDNTDDTLSGNNTASTPWAVSVPNASTGDLLVFCIAWDDSTATTDVTEPTGQNGETLSEVNATPATDSGTETRCKVWYCKCTGAWTAGTITFTPAASEQWAASVIRIPAGEFDATTPIGASVTNNSTVDGSNIQCGAFTAGGSDGGGRLCVWASADTDPQTVASGFTEISNQDIGAVSGGFFTRDTIVSDSESISATTCSTIATDSWCTVAFIIRPHVVNNEVYIATSANITAGGEATTARLTAPSGKTTSDFVTGRRWDDENGTDTIDITTDDYSEFEYNPFMAASLAGGDYVDYRVYAGSSALDTYTATPRWTIPGGAGRTTKNTRGFTHGVEVGMNWRGAL